MRCQFCTDPHPSLPANTTELCDICADEMNTVCNERRDAWLDGDLSLDSSLPWELDHDVEIAPERPLCDRWAVAS